MFVEDVAKRVTTSKSLIEEKEVEVRPEYVPTAALDENVDVYIVRKFFTSDAWLTVEEGPSTLYLYSLLSRHW